jgi:hypothetical protein
MKRVNKFYGLMVFSLVLAALLVACGDPTATVPAAKTTEAMSQPTTDAMMAKGTPDAMAKPTTEAMMAKTTEAMAAKTTDAMMAGTPAAMATTDAMMAKGTPGAMTTDAMVAKPSLLGGDFNNQGAEAVSGKAVLGKTSDGKLVLRFENLKSANGPDLYVYLTKQTSPSTADQIKAGVEIGKLKATTGNLNYELDTKLDLTQYKSVVIYCKSVNVVFGFANLNSLPA